MVGSHKHDGTSPLPLGMESSPPPENWVEILNYSSSIEIMYKFFNSVLQTGRTTQWPTDQQVGWTYCVTIPRWKIINAPSGLTFHPTAVCASDLYGFSFAYEAFLQFFVVEVGIRSPSGLSSLHAFLRRFSDFLRLYSSVCIILFQKLIRSPVCSHFNWDVFLASTVKGFISKKAYPTTSTEKHSFKNDLARRTPAGSYHLL